MPSLRRIAQVGILKSRVGGLDRGFMLFRDPELMFLYKIIIALEGSLRWLHAVVLLIIYIVKPNLAIVVRYTKL